jgi:hypothetical protein
LLSASSLGGLVAMTDLFPLEQLDHVDSWQPINLNTLPDKPPIEPTLGNTGLLYPGKRHVFSGPPESAKTLAAYAVLIVVAQHARAVLIDFEMGARDAKKRLQELGADDHTLSQIGYLEPDEPATPARLAGLVEFGPDLVVIDAAAGAYQVEGYDDNKRSDVEKFSRLYVGAFWLAGIATIVIDHVTKNIEGRGKFVIGSERKLGSSDVHLGFDTIQPISRGTSGRYKITTHKDRGGCLKRGHLADLELDSDPATHRISWAFTEPQATTSNAGYFRPTRLMEKVSIDLENRVEPPSRNRVYEALGGTKDYILKAIDALLREGFITETPGPNRSKLLESVRPYRENEPVDNPESDTTSSVVRELFGSGSMNNKSSSGSGGSRTGGTHTTDHTMTDHQKPSQWFEELAAPFDPTWADEMRPDDET